MLNTTSYRLLSPWQQSGNSLARIATDTTSSASTVASREKANSKLNLTKRTKEDKHVIYSMPIEEQFETLSKNKEGYEVSRHILKDKKEMDNNRVLDATKLLSKFNNVRILPEIHASELDVRNRLGLP